MKSRKSHDNPVTAAPPLRRFVRKPKITKEEHETPIAVLEEHGLQVSIVDMLEIYGGAIYLGDVAYWTDADFLRVENIGQQSVAEIRRALTCYLNGSRPLPGFNVVNSESLAEVRDGRWKINDASKSAKHTPWTLVEYGARVIGMLPDDI